MIRVERHGVEGTDGARSFVEVVLNRPERKNALTPEMAERLTAETEGLQAQAVPPAAMILRGEGDAFCAGFDLKMCHADPENLRRLLEALSGAIVAMRAFEGVVVCAAHGAAIAGGCALLGGADVVVSTAGTKLGYPVVRLGISPAVSAPFVINAVGSGAARGMMLDPGLIDGRRALALGLVHELAGGEGEDAAGRTGAEEGALVAEWSRALAREVARKPAVGLHATKRLMNELDGSVDAARIKAGLEVSLGLVGDEESRRRLAEMWG
ncbi:MAG: enoyl-CoA hydratase/isomerase family protein [Phycisphaeraceae bacterium]|nr:enoyl-CoA hydratase/isomerase family protein [Phycisphaeraceae bacterium]